MRAFVITDDANSLWCDGVVYSSEQLRDVGKDTSVFPVSVDGRHLTFSNGGQMDIASFLHIYEKPYTTVSSIDAGGTLFLTDGTRITATVARQYLQGDVTSHPIYVMDDKVVMSNGVKIPLTEIKAN